MKWRTIQGDALDSSLSLMTFTAFIIGMGRRLLGAAADGRLGNAALPATLGFETRENVVDADTSIRKKADSMALSEPPERGARKSECVLGRTQMQETNFQVCYCAFDAE
jgi:hypothetical protein